MQKYVKSLVMDYMNLHLEDFFPKRKKNASGTYTYIPVHTEKVVAENDVALIPTVSNVPPETKIADSRMPCTKCGLLISPDYSCPKSGAISHIFFGDPIEEKHEPYIICHNCMTDEKYKEKFGIPWVELMSFKCHIA